LIGAYSPDHANLRSGWGKGTRVQISSTDGTYTLKKMYYVTNIDPLPGAYGDRKVQVQCADYMDYLASQQIRGVGVQFDKRANEVIAAIVGALPVPPLTGSYDVGAYVFPYSLDTEQAEKTTAYTSIVKAVLSDLGFFYAASDATSGETLTYESKASRDAKTSASVTLSNTMSDLVAHHGTDLIINDARATVFPRRVDTSDVLLAQLDQEISIGAGAEATYTFRYVDPSGAGARVSALSTVSPVPNTHYKFSSVAEDGGNDLNASLDVSFIAEQSTGDASSVKFKNNAGVTGYLNLFKIYGKGIYTYQPVESVSAAAVTSDSVRKFGTRSYTMQLPYQTDAGVAATVSAAILAAYQNGITDVESVMFWARNTALEQAALRWGVGTRITVTETVTGISRDFFIHGVEHIWPAKNIMQVRWNLYPVI
jgi:hypothetical protein